MSCSRSLSHTLTMQGIDKLVVRLWERCPQDKRPRHRRSLDRLPGTDVHGGSWWLTPTRSLVSVQVDPWHTPWASTWRASSCSDWAFPTNLDHIHFVRPAWVAAARASSGTDRQPCSPDARNARRRIREHYSPRTFWNIAWLIKNASLIWIDDHKHQRTHLTIVFSLTDLSLSANENLTFLELWRCLWCGCARVLENENPCCICQRLQYFRKSLSSQLGLKRLWSIEKLWAAFDSTARVLKVCVGTSPACNMLTSSETKPLATRKKYQRPTWTWRHL